MGEAENDSLRENGILPSVTIPRNRRQLLVYEGIACDSAALTWVGDNRVVGCDQCLTSLGNAGELYETSSATSVRLDREYPHSDRVGCLGVDKYLLQVLLLRAGWRVEEMDDLQTNKQTERQQLDDERYDPGWAES